MGGNSSSARGGSDYRAAGNIEGVVIVEGTGKQHNVPFLSPDGKPRIKLNPDGSVRQMRIYDPQTGRPKMDLDYTPEPSLAGGGERIFHYHKWSPAGVRSPALEATRELYEEYKKYLKGVEFHEKR